MELQEAHVALDNDLRELENAIHGTAPNGRAEVVRCLARVRLTLAEHFRFEEHNGYMTGVLKREPSLDQTVRGLLKEHQQLAHSLDDLISEVRSRDNLEDSLLGKIKDWLKHVRQHESKENQLVQEVYGRDTGAED
jgi:hypothetical protein